MADRPVHRPDRLKTITIVEGHGSFLLVRGPSGFTVMERRNGRIYPMAPGEREGVETTAEAVAACWLWKNVFPRAKRGGSFASSARGAIASPRRYGNTLSRMPWRGGERLERVAASAPSHNG